MTLTIDQVRALNAVAAVLSSPGINVTGIQVADDDGQPHRIERRGRGWQVW